MPDDASSTSPLFIGVDVGGTNVKIGVVDSGCNVICEGHFPTDQAKGPQYALDRAALEVGKLLHSTGRSIDDAVACGLGTPGPMDIQAGTILEPANLPGWRHYNVRDGLAAAIGLPVTYTNDANAAAYGEYWAGGGAEFASMILITLGTGVGGGIIINERWIDGAHSHGAEVGHIVIDTTEDARVCSCGIPGHLEAYTSATALVARAKETVATGVETSLSELNEITALEVSNAAEAGDAVASKLVMDTADYLARGIATLAHVIDPEAIILGGAMNFGASETELGRNFLQRIAASVSKWTFPTVAKNLTIDFAKLESAAGWIGAAGISRAEYLKNQAK